MKKTVSLIACLFALSACGTVSTQSATSTSQESAATTKIIEMNSKEDFLTIQAQEKAFLVYFYKNMPPLNLKVHIVGSENIGGAAFKPKMGEIAKEFKLPLIMIDMDKQKETVDKLFGGAKISVPAVALFKGTDSVFAMEILASTEEMTNTITEQLKQHSNIINQ